MKQVLATIFAGSVLSFYLADQAISPPTIEWQQNFGGTNWESAYCVSQTFDGGYIVGGAASPGLDGNKTSLGFGESDFWVVRLDRNGDKLWDRSFGGEQDDALFDLQQTSDGGFILAGFSVLPTLVTKTARISAPPMAGWYGWTQKGTSSDANGNKL